MAIAVDYRGMDCGREGCPIPPGSQTSHYHCTQCDSPEPTSYMGHYVGGNRPDARVICNAAERRAYLQSISG